MKTPTVIELINDLKDSCGFTSEELIDIQNKMLGLAFAASVDSKVLDEVHYLLDLIPLDKDEERV
jgi:hypothetical protein